MANGGTLVGRGRHLLVVPPLLAGLLGLLVCAGVGWSQAPIGQVHSATGGVTCTRQQRVYPVTPGWALQEGDILMTDQGAGRVAVTMVDGTRFALGARSRLVLRRYVYNPMTQAGAMQADLPAGTLAVQSGKLGARGDATLAVTTPKATVHVQDAQVGIRAGKE
jgi:hypothetical protein